MNYNYEKPIITIFDDIEFYEDIEFAEISNEYWIMESECPFYGFDKDGQIMRIRILNINKSKFLEFYFDGEYNKEYMKTIILNKLINHYDFSYLVKLSPEQIFELAMNIYPYNK